MAATVTLTHTNSDRKVVRTQVPAAYATAHLSIHRPVEPKYMKTQWIVSHTATGYAVARFGLRREAKAAAEQLERAGGELWGFTSYDAPLRLELYTRLAASGVLEQGVLVGRCGS